MDLKPVKGIGPAKQEKLKAAGITTVGELARCDVEAVALRSGIPAAQVRDFKQRAAAVAVLENLKGFGPGSFSTLSERGAASVRELYGASADWLAAEIKVAQAKLAALKQEAEAMARHVAAEAKTSEGRARLAAEGRAAAQTTAKKAEETTRKAVAAAERARDAAVARAKELQREAPKALHQAQETVREAETRLRAAVQRIEQTVRAEARKTKARTERAVTQAKSRLDKAP